MQIFAVRQTNSRFGQFIHCHRLSTAWIWLIFLYTLILPATVTAQSVNYLSIEGDDSTPGNLGPFPDDSLFSWMEHTFPENVSGFSWILGPGSDGGILFDQPQSTSEMMGIRAMFNQPTTFHSIGTGLSVDNDGVIDMANLRMWHGGVVIDVGSGSGFDTLVPFVLDISTLSSGMNGWMLNSDGTYRLTYNTQGTCDGCTLTLHLYGAATVPVPAAVWLFCSGLIGLISIAKRKKA